MLSFEDLPVEAVIVSSSLNTREHYSNDDKICFSDDGVSPSLGSKEPQSKKCAVCVQNQWGSQITSNGKLGKGCGEFSILKLRHLSNGNQATSLRVPAASLKAFRDYEKQIISRGEELNRVVTQVDATHTKQRITLAFRVVRFLDDDELDALTQPPKPVSSFAVTDGYIH